MKKFASLFTKEEREALETHLGVRLDDDHDYTEDEIGDIYCDLTENFPYEYGPEGPVGLGVVFEDIIDVFCKNDLIDRADTVD